MVGMLVGHTKNELCRDIMVEVYFRIYWQVNVTVRICQRPKIRKFSVIGFWLYNIFLKVNFEAL